MIQANEVRRGNLVEYEGRVFEIDIIAEEFPTLNTQEFGIGVVSWKDLGGVMLTEKWLVKFGFEQWDKNKWVDKNGVITISKLGEGFLYLANQRHVNIFYVHQLQNLYFALTGEELTLTPSETHNN